MGEAEKKTVIALCVVVMPIVEMAFLAFSGCCCHQLQPVAPHRITHKTHFTPNIVCIEPLCHHNLS